MNNFFKPTRFGRLLRAHWAEKWREYAWFVAVLAMLDVVALVIVFVSVYGSGLYPFQFMGQGRNSSNSTVSPSKVQKLAVGTSIQPPSSASKGSDTTAMPPRDSDQR